MTLNSLKRVVSYLPFRWQQSLKRFHFSLKIQKGLFRSYEPEYNRLDEWVQPGDWVLDIGANVGHYSAKLSELVGISGRVICLEPVPQTFELLSTNMNKCTHNNVTLLNVAASEEVKVVGMSMGEFSTGLKNFYEARVSNRIVSLTALAIPVDFLNIPMPISLSKIDVEGHELSVLKGMRNLIKRDCPVMIVEGRCEKVFEFLTSLGYSFTECAGSPNRIFFKNYSPGIHRKPGL